MCLDSQDYQSPRSSARDPSLAALEMALNIVRDLVYADLTDNILDAWKMPLTAVVLLKKAGMMAIWLESQYHRSTTISVLPHVIQSLERVNHRWKVTGQLMSSLFPLHLAPIINGMTIPI